MKYEIRVQLKKNVLNVEAKEVLSAVQSQGFAFVKSLQTAKLFVIELNSAISETDALEQVTKIAKEILANEVIENFYITKINQE